MKLYLQVLITSILMAFCISCQADVPAYENQPFTSTSGTFRPGEETRIELGDGAAIVIPAEAIDAEASITIERNPAKIESLPPLGQDGMQLGDFYNFEVTGGELIGAVDLVLPFDGSLIPEGDGILSIAFPTTDGWEFVPVEADEDRVTIYTTHLGDPLIYWHFGNSQERIDWGRVVADEEPSESLLVCDQYIPLSVSPGSGPVGTEFTVSGRLLPVREIPGWASYAGAELSDLPSPGGVSVEVSFGGNYLDQSAKTVKVTTGEGGGFETSLTPDEVGWVYVSAKAQCDAWFGVVPVPSEGRVDPIRVYEEEEAEAVETEAPQKEYKVESGVLLPDFTGQPMDEAIDWLKDKGFGFTWVDGSSTYELGVVYKQTPKGEKYYVPHRTTVVLYRTIEQVEDPYGCSSPLLTPEERANCGLVRYEVTSTFLGNCLYCDDDDCEKKSKVRTTIVEVVQYFKDDKMFFGLPGESTATYEKVDINTYKFVGSEYTVTIVYALDGQTITTDTECLGYSEYKILKTE
ncbi:MAG: PASTA domain-containing protein [Anaerolineales bacterium]|jgi:hypothetical protein